MQPKRFIVNTTITAVIIAVAAFRLLVACRKTPMMGKPVGLFKTASASVMEYKTVRMYEKPAVPLMITDHNIARGTLRGALYASSDIYISLGHWITTKIL